MATCEGLHIPNCTPRGDDLTGIHSHKASDFDASLNLYRPERHFAPNPRSRARAVDPRYRYAWDKAKYARLSDRAAWEGLDLPVGSYPRNRLRAYHTKGLRANGAAGRTPGWGFAFSKRCGYYEKGGRGQNRASVGLRAEETEGRELARDVRVRMPREVERERRLPSLEREEAFWDERTVKRRNTGSTDFTPVGKVDESPRRGRRGWSPESSTLSDEAVREDAREAEAVAELYRMGILYDDEHLRGSGFNFDNLAHDDSQPAYEVRVKATTRGRKRRALSPTLWEKEGRLSLKLSLAALGDDDALARWLIAPEVDEQESQRSNRSDDVLIKVEVETQSQSQTPPSPPLTVIDESSVVEVEFCPPLDMCSDEDASRQNADPDVICFCPGPDSHTEDEPLAEEEAAPDADDRQSEDGETFRRVFAMPQSWSETAPECLAVSTEMEVTALAPLLADTVDSTLMIDEDEVSATQAEAEYLNHFSDDSDCDYGLFDDIDERGVGASAWCVSHDDDTASDIDAELVTKAEVEAAKNAESAEDPDWVVLS
jgi:hypothetical protein